MKSRIPAEKAAISVTIHAEGVAPRVARAALLEAPGEPWVIPGMFSAIVMVLTRRAAVA